MITLTTGISYCDLLFLDVPRVIATAVLQGPGGVALIDPGPSTTLPTLRAELERAGISIRDVTAIVLTHIHLDHAGATGTLVSEQPRARVYVHEIGARHLVDPAKLLASAARLYGDDMDRLWGEVRPVPQDVLVTLKGAERVAVGGRELEVLYTPGHASHHVSYFARDAGLAFVGDTAGIRRVPEGLILAPTPPPDIDLEAWRASLAAVGRWNADTIFLTHFGPHGATAVHLREMADQLDHASALVKATLAREGPDEDRERWFVEEIRALIRRRGSERELRAYEVAARFDLSWRGLARYWRKRSEAPGAGRPST